MNYGYQNELDFVNYFNDKYLYELDNNSKLFLKELFGEFIDNTEKIKSWKNKMAQKADIFIKYKNIIKSVSLKCGKNIDKYISYHYGYKKNDDGTTDFTQQLSSEEYKELYQHEINDFNQTINKTRIIVDMIDRFLVRGRNSDYDIDALVSGLVDDYVWILKYDLYDLILSKKDFNYTSPHIACMTIGPKKRNLNGNSLNVKDRYQVCIRWNFIRENIIEFRKWL